MSNVMTYFFFPHKIIKDAHRCTDIYISKKTPLQLLSDYRRLYLSMYSNKKYT